MVWGEGGCEGLHRVIWRRGDEGGGGELHRVVWRSGCEGWGWAAAQSGVKKQVVWGENDNGVLHRGWGGRGSACTQKGRALQYRDGVEKKAERGMEEGMQRKG